MKIARRNRVLWPAIAAATVLLFVLAACSPAGSNDGVDVGSTSPPFAMTLTDGSEVSLKNLVEENQATHLFWFATW